MVTGGHSQTQNFYLNVKVTLMGQVCLVGRLKFTSRITHLLFECFKKPDIQRFFRHYVFVYR